MDRTEVEPDGSIHYREFGLSARWSSLTDLAADFWRSDRSTDREQKLADDMLAYSCVSDLTSEPVWSRALEVIDALLELARDEAEIGYIAAGPLEDLVRTSQALRLISDIERRARRSAKFRRAVSGIWLDRSGNDALNRRLALLGAHFPDGSMPS